jgi:hypothetical protein
VEADSHAAYYGLGAGYVCIAQALVDHHQSLIALIRSHQLLQAGQHPPHCSCSKPLTRFSVSQECSVAWVAWLEGLLLSDVQTIKLIHEIPGLVLPRSHM